jgi:hypothetical protein
MFSLSFFIGTSLGAFRNANPTQLAIFGPISQYHSNSAFYSAIAPARDQVTDLMPVTVQVPVYKVRAINPAWPDD